MKTWEYIEENYNPSSDLDRKRLTSLGKQGFEVYHVADRLAKREGAGK